MSTMPSTMLTEMHEGAFAAILAQNHQQLEVPIPAIMQSHCQDQCFELTAAA